MDGRAHRRFLDYLDAFECFTAPERAKLERVQWEALDAELRSLLAIESERVLTADERGRVGRLRLALLRD